MEKEREREEGEFSDRDSPIDRPPAEGEGTVHAQLCSLCSCRISYAKRICRITNWGKPPHIVGELAFLSVETS